MRVRSNPFILPALLGAMMVLVETIQVMKTGEITLGETIIIGLSLISMGCAALLWAIRLWRDKHPVSMEFLIPDTQKYRRSHRIATGQQEVQVRLSTRVPSAVSRIDVRFVEQRSFKRWKYKDASPANVKVLDIQNFEQGEIGVKELISTKLPTVEGAIKFIFGRGWTAGHFLYFTLTVHSSSSWAGYLSFEIDADHRLYVRRPFTVMEDAYAVSIR
jgi:hypothetical protein